MAFRVRSLHGYAGEALPMREVPQEITSEDTSRPQVPELFKFLTKYFGWNKRSVNFDLGGGKYELGTEYLRGEGVTNLVFDRYGRLPEHNAKVLARVNRYGFDTVTCANVLNVIAEPSSRSTLIAYASKLADESRSKVAFFSVFYESGRKGGVTKTKGGVPKTWQEQRPLRTYVPEIAKHFKYVRCFGLAIFASNVKAAIDAYVTEAESNCTSTGAKKGRAAGMASAKVTFDAERYKRDVNALKIGKRLSEAVYLHRSAIEALPPALLELVGVAEDMVLAALATPAGVDWDLVKLSRLGPQISLLKYPTFMTDAFPAIEKSWTVDFETGKVRPANYSNNRPILHRKETFLLPSHPRAEEFAKLTRKAESLGLFDADKNRIGREDFWDALLAKKGLRVVGNRIVASR